MTNNLQIIGLKELRAAVMRNPAKVQDEANTFLSRGLYEYKKGVINDPWRMGGGGGGAPVATKNGGNLRDTHQTKINGLVGYLYPTAKYAPYVHGLKGYPRKRKYQLRPWLDYVKKNKDSAIQVLYRKMLGNIVSDLAK